VTIDDKPIANPYVVLREEFDDWAVLFNPDTGHGFGLNPTGVYLWKLLNGEYTLDALLLKTRHDADTMPEEARDHIGTFVEALVAQGLAGVDRMAFGPAKNSIIFPERLGEEKPFRYEPPQLVHFLTNHPARGLCQYGSGDSASCLSGKIAGSRCQTGYDAANDCGTGASKHGNCLDGGTPQNNRNAGGVPANTCNTGGTPY
jgi:SynChlorMet cassette protein ScmD